MIFCCIVLWRGDVRDIMVNLNSESESRFGAKRIELTFFIAQRVEIVWKCLYCCILKARIACESR